MEAMASFSKWQEQQTPPPYASFMRGISANKSGLNIWNCRPGPQLPKFVVKGTIQKVRTL